MEKDYVEFNARYLNLLTDFGFHKVFGEDVGKKLLMNFLNYVIKEEGHIKQILYLNPEQLGNFKTDRKAVFDIFCITEKGEYFIVEMQKAKQEFFRERSIFYASVPIRKQAPKGKWNFHLKGVYVVAILDFVIFDEFKEDKEFYIEHVYLTRERTKTVYSNKLKFTFVELPKFGKSEENLKTDLDIWLFLLKNMHLLKDRPASIRGKFFDKLFEIAEINQLTEADMEKYEKSVLDYYDVQDAMKFARKEGREEGRKEGIEKEKISIIQKCLQKNIAIEDIVFLTGYSKEQIIQYKTKN